MSRCGLVRTTPALFLYSFCWQLMNSDSTPRMRKEEKEGSTASVKLRSRMRAWQHKSSGSASPPFLSSSLSCGREIRSRISTSRANSDSVADILNLNVPHITPPLLGTNVSRVPRKRKRSLMLTHQTSSDSLLLDGEDETTYSDVELLEVIGRGSSSTVYSCTVGGWNCAVKVIPTTNFSGLCDPMSELKLLEVLPTHKNLVQYLSSEQKEEELYIYLQQYQTSLDAIIATKVKSMERFTKKEIIDMLLQVAKGLKMLHAHKIIHRDIKSHNIFVNTNLKGERRCVIGDLDSAILISRRRKATTTIGTPCFMAPEIFHNEGTYSYPADIYSFGMLIFELITLSLPFSDIPFYQIVAAIQKSENPKLPDDLDPELHPLVCLHKNCINKKPKDRPRLSQVISNLKSFAKQKRKVRN